MAGAADATMLLELMDDSDEINTLMMMMQENHSLSLDNAATSAAVIHTLSFTKHREKLTLLQNNARDMYNLPEPEFFNQMRVTKQTFDILLKIMDYYYQPVHRGGFKPNDSLCTLILALQYLGTTLTYAEISKRMETSNTNVYMAVQTAIDIFCKVAPEFLHWPSKDELSGIESGFQNVAGMPGVVGAMAGIQIKFKYSVSVGESYVTKRNLTTFHVLGICNDKSAFTYINIGYPGSAEEQEVLKSTSFYRIMEENPLSLFTSDDQHIVANSVYPASKHVLVPFRDFGLLSDEQVKFNQHLFQTRFPIVEAFGQLKARFPRLDYFDSDIKKITKMVKTCCVLHNIAVNFPWEVETLRNQSSVFAIETEEATPTFDIMSYDADEDKLEKVIAEMDNMKE
ncbi:hypothetical protein Pmani_037979 [Petrolisthes manimaculis]|uniref:DDE Tnp4 domain-containing protein n=1 Tax=Petrolisthes manimaculis TaxID=1843537 RepID=A0AAE1NHZ8_9EUCA|nr:hypothetical protein Pmani_037979 [Petrolisthes manimaculis]